MSETLNEGYRDELEYAFESSAGAVNVLYVSDLV